MKKTLFAGLAVGVIMFGVSGVASANLVTNGDFSTNDITGWIITGGDYSDASGGFFVAFANSGWAILSQNITTSSGQQYDISFDTAASQLNGNQFAWSIDGGSLNNITTTTSWATNNGTFTATGGSTNIEFYLATDSMTGVWSLDNVSVDANGTAPVPEPATMLLLGTGLTGLIGARRKKKA